MSDRDDIDVIDLANDAASESESVTTEENTNSNNKFNQAIRQNPLTHAGEESAKPSFFEKLKRAFSIDEAPNEDIADSQAQSDEGLIEDGGSILGGFMNKLKRTKDRTESDSESDKKNIEEIIDELIGEVGIDTDNELENKENDDFDPEEEEEFRMISAFLDGEEYIPPEQEKSETESENDNQKEVIEVHSESDANAEDIEEKSASGERPDNINTEEYDIRDAFEDEEAEFDAQDAFENEEAEFVMIDIDEEESAEDIGIDDASADITEAESSEQSSSEEKAESEAEKESVENASEHSHDDKPKTESGEASTTQEVKAESEALETENDKKDNIENEDNKENNNNESSEKASDDEIKSESLSEKVTPVSEIDDDDEEFRFDDDYIFDESDDEDLAELAKLDTTDDFKGLNDIIEDQTSTEEKTASENTEENISEKSEDKAESAEASEDTENTENTEDTENSEIKAVEKTEEEKSESEETEISAENIISDILQEMDNTNQSAPENKSEESEKPQGTGSAASSEEISVVSSNSESLEANTEIKQEKNNVFGKFRNLCSRAKNKLIEMWNEKEDEPENAKPSEPAELTAVTEQEKTNVTSLADEEVKKISTAEAAVGTENNSDLESVFESDSDNTVSQNKETEEEKYVDISKAENAFEEKASDSEKKTDNVIPMTLIKNESVHKTELDVEKMRESLNVIEGEKHNIGHELLTEEQKRQSELNQKVLEKVKQYEDETAERREELRKAREERSAKAYEKAFGTVDPITEIEITDYIVPGIFEEIKVKAGKFSESVRSEYEFYVGYSRLKNVAKKQANITHTGNVPKVTERSKPSESPKDKSENRYAEFSDDRFAKSRDRLDGISKRLDYRDLKHPERLEYRSEEDAAKVKSELQKEYKQAKLQWNISLALTFVMFILSCFAGKFTVGGGENAKDSSERLFAFLNLALYGVMLFNCRDIIIGGLLPLKRVKSNSDTGTAVAALVAAVQSLFALIAPSPFLRQGLNVYTLLVMLALTVNSLGRNINAHRIVSNFRFVSDSSQKYTGKFFHDQRMVATLLSGTRNDKSELVFQKKTAFLKHFVKLSYSPDPGEELADKFSIPTIIFSIIISIVYAFVSKSFIDAVSVLCVMLCAAVPMCSKALGAIPLHKLAKNSLANQSMVVGYQAVENFSESAAVMLDAKELYPEGSVHLNGIKTFDSRRIDDAMFAAASVIITAGGAMVGMFDGIIQGDKQENLPTAEGVMYEDGKGLIGWVNNERIFVGNRRLLLAHGIDPMTEEYEEKHKDGGNEILYLACAGELVAMFIVGYSANRRVADALRRMEANGMSLLIRTTDVNITADRIAKDFGVSHRSIKILEQKNSNVIRDEMIGKEKASPAFIATKGGVTSFGRAVSGCIQTKRNISLSLAVQIVGVLLGLLIVTLIVLFAGIHHVGAIQLFMFYLFWVIAVLAAPPIIQKIQKY